MSSRSGSSPQAFLTGRWLLLLRERLPHAISDTPPGQVGLKWSPGVEVTAGRHARAPSPRRNCFGRSDWLRQPSADTTIRSLRGEGSHRHGRGREAAEDRGRSRVFVRRHRKVQPRITASENSGYRRSRDRGLPVLPGQGSSARPARWSMTGPHHRDLAGRGPRLFGTRASDAPTESADVRVTRSGASPGAAGTDAARIFSTPATT